jgi:hypothetical protein
LLLNGKSIRQGKDRGKEKNRAKDKGYLRVGWVYPHQFFNQNNIGRTGKRQEFGPSLNDGKN